MATVRTNAARFWFNSILEAADALVKTSLDRLWRAGLESGSADRDEIWIFCYGGPRRTRVVGPKRSSR